MQHQENFQAAQAYRQAAVAVPPLRAVVMMIDGAITALQKSVAASEDKKFEESHDLMIRATAILRGLSHNLNFDRGGEVAEGLHATYHTLIMACLRSFGQPNAAQCYGRIIASLTELRDAWVVVARSTAKPV
ncbi:flagellar protein FliS [Tardiphaga robiniae]|uniref:Flagellar biosynthesis protein FliS n=1 Tax=Tardiphaga robiniae TaxID=943830 RepID=A0A161SU61_9BRAD|nr:flagellar protein FliS [Tardiphaga robiniae]KZD25122.1 flagellar biosynthesis protein FliS [Tardiphaga robiniae]